MPTINPRRLSDGEAARLARLYTDAEREILAAVNRALLRGNQAEYLREMQTNVNAILDALRNGSRTWCEQAIPKVYVASTKYADQQLPASAVGNLRAGFGAVHQQAAQVLAEAAYGRFNESTLMIGRRVDDIYRTLALENVRGSVVGYKAWQQVAKNFREQIAAQGVTGFRDRLGRQWNMRTYAEMVARTTTMEAHLEGTKNRLLEHGYDLVKVSEHPGTCELCRPWQGKILSLTGNTPGYQTMAEAKAAGLFHPNCFPAGVLVNGPLPLAAFARWYEGKMVIITTASGIELSVTPNHPILTPKGWIAAGLLNIGDNIVRCIGQKGMMDGIDPDYKDIPTPIEQVVRSFGESGNVPSRTMPVSSKDFHGDGVGSEVYIVWANSLLMDEGDPPLLKPAGKNSLSFADMRAFFLNCFGAITQRLERTLASSRNFVRDICKLLSFFRGHSANTDTQSGRTVFGSDNTKSSKTLLDSRLVNTQAFGNSLFCLSSKIAAQDGFPIQRDTAIQSGFSKIADFDPVFFEYRFDSLFAGVENCRELAERLSGSIAIDEVISIKFDSFSGHVYNLQTKYGWYIANTIITHNCRHAYGLYADLEEEPPKLEEELNDAEKIPGTTYDTLPGYENAIIPPEKLIRYSLNKEHPKGRDKAIAFDLALGYTITNYLELIGNIRENLKHFPATYKGKDKHGEHYEVIMVLSGPNGKAAKVLTGWIIDIDEQLRMVTAYVDKRQ